MSPHWSTLTTTFTAPPGQVLAPAAVAVSPAPEVVGSVAVLVPLPQPATERAIRIAADEATAAVAKGRRAECNWVCFTPK
jgi:hypothetical protein